MESTGEVGGFDGVAEQRLVCWACWRGKAAGLGGWTFVTRLSLSTLLAAGIGFFGPNGSTASLATALALVKVMNCIGIGFRASPTSAANRSSTMRPVLFQGLLDGLTGRDALGTMHTAYDGLLGRSCWDDNLLRLEIIGAPILAKLALV